MLASQSNALIEYDGRIVEYDGRIVEYDGRIVSRRVRRLTTSASARRMRRAVIGIGVGAMHYVVDQAHLEGPEYSASAASPCALWGLSALPQLGTGAVLGAGPWPSGWPGDPGRGSSV
ncbi:hypothetical protein ACWEO2_14855 [Nocardia sp. NPDC004278]